MYEDLIEPLIAAFLSDPKEVAFARALTRKHHALLLLGTFHGWYLLRPDGRVAFVADVHPDGIDRDEVPEPERLLALSHAASKWPELAALLPKRDVEPDCKACEGRGAWVIARHRRVCADCYGLGWIPEL